MAFVILGTFFFIMAELFFNTIMTTSQFYSWQIRSVIMREYAMYRDHFFNPIHSDDPSIPVGFVTEDDEILPYTLKDASGNETSVSVSALADDWALYFNPNGQFHVRYGSVMKMLDTITGTPDPDYEAYKERVITTDTETWDMGSQQSRLRTLIDAERQRQSAEELILTNPNRNVWDNNQ
jgi:hypothetical protein